MSLLPAEDVAEEDNFSEQIVIGCFLALVAGFVTSFIAHLLGQLYVCVVGF